MFKGKNKYGMRFDMYRIRIYIENKCVTTATGEDREFLERWGTEVCKEALSEHKKARYTIEILA